jgi:hypothetical protein
MKRLFSLLSVFILHSSSGSLSLLPASPKIFYGRESELKDLLDILRCDPARAAIMGPGGMGKTTVAMAALHHPAIIEKYNLRYFISYESADACADMVAIIGLHLGWSRQIYSRREFYTTLYRVGHV